MSTNTNNDPFRLDDEPPKVSLLGDVDSVEAGKSRDLVRLGVTDEAIEELRRQYAGLTIPDGDEDAYKAVSVAISTLSSLRTQVENRRKEIKAPLLERGRILDAEAKRITAKLREIEEPLVQERGRILEQKRAEKEAREKEEAERVERHRSRIREMQERGASVSKSIEELEGFIAALEATEISAETFEEFASEAVFARSAALDRLRTRVGELRREEEERKAREAEEARLRAEREELERRDREIKKREEALRQQEEEKRRAEEVKAAEERAAREAEERVRREEQERREREERERREAEERAEAERKAREEAEARKPDVEKVRAWLTEIEITIVDNAPVVSDERAARFRQTASDHLVAELDKIRRAVAKLEGEAS